MTDTTKVGTTPANAAGSPEPVSAEPREAKASDKDIGNWKFEPWSGQARWVHPATNQESFDEKYVKRHKDL
jgi:hypothetical protein